MSNMKAFLTGSRVYGTPREDSDIDLVVMVSERDFNSLLELAEGPPVELRDSAKQPHQYALRFGRLNLICVDEDDDERYEAWVNATDELISRRPVTREQAIKVMKHHRGES